MVQEPPRRPIRWDNLRTDEAERVIRERVRDTDNVIIGNHALERVNERFGGLSFTTEDIYWILETGSIPDRPTRENAREWKVIVVKRMPGTREAGVVTLIATGFSSKWWNGWIGSHEGPIPLRRLRPGLCISPQRLHAARNRARGGRVDLGCAAPA
jgi:hypothetical protein